MKTKHDGDCAIYSCLDNCTPEDGVCTCGYGLQLARRNCDYSEMYSKELQFRLTNEKDRNPKHQASLTKRVEGVKKAKEKNKRGK